MVCVRGRSRIRGRGAGCNSIHELFSSAIKSPSCCNSTRCPPFALVCEAKLCPVAVKQSFGERSAPKCNFGTRRSAPGSARVSRAGDGVPDIANFPLGVEGQWRAPSLHAPQEVRRGETPRPARGTRALPGVKASPLPPRAGPRALHSPWSQPRPSVWASLSAWAPRVCPSR